MPSPVTPGATLFLPQLRTPLFLTPVSSPLLKCRSHASHTFRRRRRFFRQRRRRSAAAVARSTPALPESASPSLPLTSCFFAQASPSPAP